MTDRDLSVNVVLPANRNPASGLSSGLYIGLMSGTSLDGVDGALASFAENADGLAVSTKATAYLPFDGALRAELMALQAPSANEIEREAIAANALGALYAQCIAQLLEQSGVSARDICAAGIHGQTIRHRPELGFTRQINHPALVAELSGINIVADFRSRDIAAGGQGAPLVPAFHQAAFGNASETRVIVNIGGIANLSILPGQSSQPADNAAILGWDTGPGNVLMDHWAGIHLGKPYDDNGAWAASGNVIPALLETMLREPFFGQSPPKSTGRDLFHAQWLANKVVEYEHAAPADIQATLAALTAASLADAVATHAPACRAVYVCGGGARNAHLLAQIGEHLRRRGRAVAVASTSALGMAPGHVEALAFAWLAARFMQGKPGSLPAVTGARGARILGALYPSDR